MAIERIQLNLIPTGKMPVCHTKQYDKGREIGIDLLYGLKPYYLTDEALELDVRKSDNHLVTIDVPYTEGTSSVVFATTEQMCAVSGSNICALKVTKGGVVIGSLNFVMEVEKSVLEGGLPSESDIENLETQMSAIIDPMLDDKVPPLVEELVPQVVGDNYYNKTEINTIVDGIDTALEGIGHDIDGINDDIDNLETELESKADANEVAQALEGKADKETTYTKEEVDDIVYNILPDDTASGSVANFETDLALPLKSLEIDVNAKQDLHGYDYPWTAGGGKNLLNKSSYSYIRSSNIVWGGTTQGYADGSFNLKAGTYTFSVSVTCNGLYISDNESQIAVSYNRAFVTFTIAEDKAIKLMVYKTGVTQDDLLSYNYQLEKGSAATDWTPYENICPIEGWSEVQIANCDNTELAPFLRGLLQGKYGFVRMNSLSWQYSSYAGTDYFVTSVSLPNVKAPATSGQTANAICDGYENVPSNGVTSPVFVSGTMFILTTGRLFLKDANYTDVSSFVSSLQGKYLIYELATPVIPTITEEQINTICEAFNANSTFVKINLGGTYYGGKLDVTTGKFLITYEKANASSENVTTYGGLSSRGVRFPSALNGSYRFAKAVCNMARIVYSTNYVLGCMAIGIDNAQIYWFGIIDLLGLADLDAFKTWLDNNPVEVYYELATPIEIQLTPTQVATLIGTNNIFADTGDTSVVFKDSVNGYVEKKIASVQALALNT